MQRTTKPYRTISRTNGALIQFLASLSVDSRKIEVILRLIRYMEEEEIVAEDGRLVGVHGGENDEHGGTG